MLTLWLSSMDFLGGGRGGRRESIVMQIFLLFSTKFLFGGGQKSHPVEESHPYTCWNIQQP